MKRVLFAPQELPELPPDVAQDSDVYASWVLDRERQRRRLATRDHAPLAIVMLALDAPLAATEATLHSLQTQTSSRWTLSVFTTDRPRVDGLLRRCLPRRRRRDVRLFSVPASTAPRELVQQGVDANPDVAIALIFSGDIWAPDTVALLAGALSPTTVVYADEDRVDVSGSHRRPRFKPDFSPDFLLSSGYIGRPLAMGHDVARTMAPLVANNAGALEHDCAIAATEVASAVVHIAEVLCHRLSGLPGSALGSPSTDHVQAALRRREDPADVHLGSIPDTFRVVRHHNARPVSIVVPFRDQPQLLRTCVDSVTATTRGLDVEFVLVNNGSTDPEILTLLERFAPRDDVQILDDPRPFNWAQLNNAGVRAARGEVLVFLNNDIEAENEDWLSALMGHALRPEIGAVGARLLYPDARLQHCGVVVGLIGAAGHPLLGLSPGKAGYLDMAIMTRECSAVTGACLATRREVFERLGGFDEVLGVDLSDVDYCLRAGAAGYRTVYEPAAELIHHESPSRGTAGGAGDIINFIDLWRDYIATGDPYFNPHLTRSDGSCGLASSEEWDRWKQWHLTLSAR